jgi:hypothetical protein
MPLLASTLIGLLLLSPALDDITRNNTKYLIKDVPVIR